MLTVYRGPESAAGCGCSSDYHNAGPATQQSKARLAVEDEAKVAQSRGALLSSGVCLQWRQVCWCDHRYNNVVSTC